MAKKTYHYTKKITATITEQKFVLPRLRNISIINTGDDEIQIEFENEIDADSIIIPEGSSYDVSTGFLDLRYKSLTESSEFYITGLLHAKE